MSLLFSKQESGTLKIGLLLWDNLRKFSFVTSVLPPTLMNVKGALATDGCVQKPHLAALLKEVVCVTL